jgi:hypothetical protein
MKLNKEIIGAIAGEYTKIGNAHVAIGEYLAQLAQSDDVPSVEEVLPTVKKEEKIVELPKKEETVKEPETVDETDGEEEEVLTAEDLEEMSVKELKKLADENGIEYKKNAKKPGMIEVILEAMEEETEESVDETTEEDVADEEDGIDLDELKKDELLSLIEENELGKAPKKKKTEKVSAYEQRLRDFIEEQLGEDTDEVEEEPVEDTKEESAEEEVSTVITVENEDGEEEDIDLKDMTKAELLAFAEEYDLEIEATKKAPIIEEILEQIYGDAVDEAEDETEDEVGEDDGEDLAEQLGLNNMDTEELAELLEEYELSTKGKKQALIDRIVRAVEDGTIEVEGE